MNNLTDEQREAVETVKHCYGVSYEEAVDIVIKLSYKPLDVKEVTEKLTQAIDKITKESSWPT